MSTLTIPTISRTAATEITFSLQANTMRSESPLNKTIQTSELPGARWVAQVLWQNLSDADSRILKAFINQLSGMAGRFYLFDYSHKIPAGSATGTALVKGASQTGRTLLTDGWTANQTALLLPGDYIGVNGELKVITVAAASDSGGNATLTFEPPLRQSPADNAAITINQPTATFILADDKQDVFKYIPRKFTSLEIDCMEVF